jgi:hypothetical protein
LDLLFSLSIPDVLSNGTLASSGYYLALIFKRSVRSPRGIIKCPDQNAKLAIAMAELGSGTNLTVRRAFAQDCVNDLN